MEDTEKRLQLTCDVFALRIEGNGTKIDSDTYLSYQILNKLVR